MKNLSIIFILLSFCVLFFSGCKKEEDPTPSVREQIIGKWNYYSRKTQRYAGNGQLEYEDSSLVTNNTSVEYREDGTFSIIRPSTPEIDEFKADGTWELIENNSKLRMIYTINNSEIINTINELTEEKLFLSSEIKVAEGGIVKGELILVR